MDAEVELGSIAEAATRDDGTALDLASILSLREFEELARARLPHMAFEYIDSGAADEITTRSNRRRYDEIRLRPRVLVDVSRVDTTVTLLGAELPHPILFAPTAYHRLVHPEGELATARAAGRTDTTWVVSTATTTPLEEIAREATSPLWFQLYVQSDREVTRALVQLAEEVGCRALCVTVDTPALGARNRQERSRFHFPEGISTPYLDDLNRGRRSHFVPEPVALTWTDIEWLRSITRLPVLLKGILTADDARRSVAAGVAGVMVSNHAGRNLDTLPATIDALPEVVDAVSGTTTVIVDGGIQRGTDVVKALALGADAVMIGRPYLYALGVGGAEGAARVLEILLKEFIVAMMLCGRPSIASLDRSVLWDG